MNITFNEQHGSGWRQRLLAVGMVLLGGFLGWLWTKQEAPTFQSAMEILTVPGQEAATEKILTTCLDDKHLLDLATTISEQNAAAARQRGWWRRLASPARTPNAAELQKRLREHFQCTWPRERILRVQLAYPVWGEPEQADELRNLYNAMQRAAENAATAAARKQTAVRDTAVKRLQEELALLKPDAAHAAAAGRILKQLRAAVKEHAAPVAAWQQLWSESPATQPYVTAVNNAWEKLAAAQLQTAQTAGRAEQLSAWIDAPQNQTVKQIVKRVVHYQDTPEMIRLKDRKAVVEAARQRLLLRATALHPQAKKMAAEIEELNAKINALMRLPQTVEDVEERTNPQLTTWRRELADAQTQHKNAQTAEDSARREVYLALQALENADRAASALQTQKARYAVEKQIKQLQSREFSPAAVPFALYLPPTPPQQITMPAHWRGYALGWGLGALCGLLILCGRRETRLHYEEPPAPAPEFPVLGVVPDFRPAEEGKSA